MACPCDRGASQTLSQWQQQQKHQQGVGLTFNAQDMHGLKPINTICVSGDPVLDPYGKVTSSHVNAPPPSLHDPTLHHRGAGPCSDVTPNSLAAMHKRNAYQPCQTKKSEVSREDVGISLSDVQSVRCGYRPRKLQETGQKRLGCPEWRGRVDWCWPELDDGTPAETPPPGPRCYSKEELEGTGWGYCPPCGDYRDLIKPRPSHIPDSERRMGPGYGSEDKFPCAEVVIPRACRANRFTFCDWLATVKDRQAPPELEAQCVPSLARWCAPAVIDCCPQFDNPRAYTLAPRAHR